jgi:hypothetical protein
MPSIELICVDQQVPLKFPAYPFALLAEPKLVSHRRPSLFQPDFDRLRGCIYHLGNPGYDEPGLGGPYFAYELLSEACTDNMPPSFLEFAPEFLPAIRDLLGLLFAASPARLVIFTTDWQGGPRSPRRYRQISEHTFWQRHAHRKLHLNALYPIRPNPGPRP